jgi:hypothetical protein
MEDQEKVFKKKPVIKKPKFKTRLYVLEQDVEVCGENGLVTLKKGTKKELTEEGARYFKLKLYIK